MKDLKGHLVPLVSLILLFVVGIVDVVEGTSVVIQPHVSYFLLLFIFIILLDIRMYVKENSQRGEIDVDTLRKKYIERIMDEKYARNREVRSKITPIGREITDLPEKEEGAK